MTNYNDGKWHGHNGGECPVHPETVVEVRNLVPYIGRNVPPMKASAFIWTGDNAGADIIAFRVIKEHKEPREFWISKNSTKIWTDKNQAEANARIYGVTLIHVREVLE